MCQYHGSTQRFTVQPASHQANAWDVTLDDRQCYQTLPNRRLAKRAARRLSLRAQQREQSRQTAPLGWLARHQNAPDPVTAAVRDLIDFMCPTNAQTPQRRSLSDMVSLTQKDIDLVWDGEELGHIVGEMDRAAIQAGLSVSLEGPTADAPLMQAYTVMVMHTLATGYRDHLTAETLHAWYDCVRHHSDRAAIAIERCGPGVHRTFTEAAFQTRLALAERDHLKRMRDVLSRQHVDTTHAGVA